MMTIRKTETKDIPEIMKIYTFAKKFMIATGNPNQWNGVYPEESLILEDIRKGISYVCLQEGEIVGTFAFILGEDPTYQVIEQGNWSKNVPYGTIHRVAGNGKAKGIMENCVQFCRNIQPYLRIDTHHDNHVMQSCLKKLGFCRCGIIYLKNGDPRVAYDLV